MNTENDVSKALAAARNVSQYLDMLALDADDRVHVVIDDGYDGDGVIQSLEVPDLRTLIAFVREVRPHGTVTDADRMEYTIAAESSNGAITQLADYTTVVRDHLKADLYLFRQEEERLKGEPDRIFIAVRPIPKWVRS